MLERSSNYDLLNAEFDWVIPKNYNMAWDVCDKWAESYGDQTAIIDLSTAAAREISFLELRQMADGLAHELSKRGIVAGDRVGVFRGQSTWTAAAHIAIWKLGAISVPLFKLFRQDALIHRVLDSGLKNIITEDETHDLANSAIKKCPTLESCFCPEGLSLDDGKFETVETKAIDPALVIYTSGTTGDPKGAVLPHQSLLGHLPGVELSHDFLGQHGDRLWTPADWAWIGGLMDVLMPGLQLGVPVVAKRMNKFNPEECRDLVHSAKITNIFFPPTALKILRSSGTSIEGLRSVASGGEPLGAEILEWGESALGVTINEFYGQTECNMVLSNASSLFAPMPGVTGRPVPGHIVNIIDDAGKITTQEGDIAVFKGSPSMMLGYWRNEIATREKFRGNWMITGDRGIKCGKGIKFIGRMDDVINSGGYRIGPSPIETCLMQHPAVSLAAVVGKPDRIRGEIIHAFIVLKDRFIGDETIVNDLKNHVRKNLAAHEAPASISFEDELPMTISGKIIRRALKEKLTREIA